MLYDLRSIVIIHLLLPIDLNKNKLTKPKITAVICSIACWRNLAEILRLPRNLEKVENMQGELERLPEELGAQFPEKMNKTKPPTIRETRIFLLYVLHPNTIIHSAILPIQ